MSLDSKKAGKAQVTQNGQTAEESDPYSEECEEGKGMKSHPYQIY